MDITESYPLVAAGPDDERCLVFTYEDGRLTRCRLVANHTAQIHEAYLREGMNIRSLYWLPDWLARTDRTIEALKRYPLRELEAKQMEDSGAVRLYADPYSGEIAWLSPRQTEVMVSAFDTRSEADYKSLWETMKKVARDMMDARFTKNLDG